MNDELYNLIEETVNKIALKTAIYYSTGTCMWCGGHNRKVKYHVFERDGRFYMSLVCDECLKEVAENDRFL